MPERNQQDDDKTTNSELESLAAIFRHQTDTSGKKRQKTDSRQTARQRGNSLSRAHHLASSSSGSRHRCAGHELPSQPVAVPDIHWLSRWRPVCGGSHLGWTAVLLFCLEPPVLGFQKKLKIKQPLDPGFLSSESRTPYPYPPVLGLNKWATIPAPRLPYYPLRPRWLAETGEIQPVSGQPGSSWRWKALLSRWLDNPRFRQGFAKVFATDENSFVTQRKILQFIKSSFFCLF